MTQSREGDTFAMTLFSYGVFQTGLQPSGPNEGRVAGACPLGTVLRVRAHPGHGWSRPLTSHLGAGLDLEDPAPLVPLHPSAGAPAKATVGLVVLMQWGCGEAGGSSCHSGFVGKDTQARLTAGQASRSLGTGPPPCLSSPPLPRVKRTDAHHLPGSPSIWEGLRPSEAQKCHFK